MKAGFSLLHSAKECGWLALYEMTSASLLVLVAFVIGIVTYFRFIRQFDVPDHRKPRRVRKKQSKAEETLAPQTSTVASTVSWTTSPTSRGLPTISATESCTESRARSCKSRFLSSSSASETTTRAMCDCGSDVKVSTADTEAQVKAMNVLDLLRPTYCSPIDYDQYRPVPQGLMSLIDSTKQTALCKEAVSSHDKPKDLGYLTPFKPILHAIHYAHKHATMLGELCDNYAYIESN